MAHASIERYAALVDAKLRHTLVKKTGIVFNSRYEGNPKAGVVNIPVRDTEAAVADYSKTNGATATQGTTTYAQLTLNKDKVVNEVIDGFDAASAPDNLVADRLDSAGYALALQMDVDGTACLEAAATVHGSTSTALTAATVYKSVVDARTALSKAKVPTAGRFLLVSPEVYAFLLLCPEFIKASDLGDAVVQSGVVGRIAGFNVLEDTTLSATTEFIAGHPDWCSRVEEWQVPVHVQDLAGSGKYVGASAVQGRKIYGYKVTKPATLLIKKKG